MSQPDTELSRKAVSLQADCRDLAVRRETQASQLALLWYATMAMSLAAFCMVVVKPEGSLVGSLVDYAPFALLSGGFVSQYLSRQQALFERTGIELRLVSALNRDDDEADSAFYRRLLDARYQIDLDFVGGRQEHRRQLGNRVKLEERDPDTQDHVTQPKKGDPVQATGMGNAP